MPGLLGTSVGRAVRFQCATSLCQRRKQGSVLVAIEKGLTLFEAMEMKNGGTLSIVSCCGCCKGSTPILTKPLTHGFSWDE